ncbi:MAG TPA: long-chain fatty acid--CoA ligase [Parasegetibacter sp.]
MNSPKRLFDCIAWQKEQHPLEAMFAGKKDGEWKKYSTLEVEDTVIKLAAGLIARGISKGDMTPEGRDKIAIISKNCPEWMMIDFAVQQTGAVLVPIYPTININELAFIMNDCKVKIIFVNDAVLYEKVMSIKDQLPHLKEVYTIEPVPGAKMWQELLDEALLEHIDKVHRIAAKIDAQDLVTIIYTSGTTGTPKGVMLSHRNILSNVENALEVFDEIQIEGGRALSFLPLNHIFERMVTYVFIYTGISIYYAESMDTIGDNLKEVKPSVFTTVPRLLEKVFEKIMAKGQSESFIKRKAFFWALDLGRKFEINQDRGWWYNAQLNIANKLVFSKWREALGGKVKAIVTGAAACQVKLLKIFTAGKIVIMEGYGLTETSPVISVNRFDEKNRMFGTVGPLLKNVEVKFEEDGEICCRGENVMMGYYKHPELTAEVIKDGWFHTGDIGTMVDNKFLKITDRKKEIFKTSGGKYVAPQPIENKMKESHIIEQIMVVGAGQKFAAALIVPAFKVLMEWCEKQGIPYPGNKEIIKDERVIGMVRSAIDRYNKHFNQVEQVKKFQLLPHEWTIDGGELTPTLKLKRKVILEKYADVIDKIYS